MASRKRRPIERLAKEQVMTKRNKGQIERRQIASHGKEEETSNRKTRQISSHANRNKCEKDV